jgi:hypothetical protein
MSRRTVVAVLLLAVSVACAKGSARIWLQGGSGERPTFGLALSEGAADPFPLGSFQVHTCESVKRARATSWIPPRDQAVWYMDWWPRDRAHPVPGIRRITYGIVPDGMQEDRPATALDGSGACYVVQAAGAGASGSNSLRTGFRITGTGTARELTAAEIDSLLEAPSAGR